MEDKLTFLKENWYFPALVVALLAMAVFGYSRSKYQATTVEETPKQQAERILRAQAAHTR